LPAVAVDGLLSVPPAPGPVPLVITSIGSLGLGSGREELYAHAFAAAGIAMLVVDSFGSRGFAETFSDQGRISFATSCADALHALRFAATDPRFDRERIVLFGYSRGGCAVVMANDERLQAAVVGSAARFAGYVALYPSVWLRWAHPHPTAGPMLFVLGGNDTMAPLARTRERAEQLAAAGASVETLVLPQAQHSFDTLVPARWNPDETNMSDCDVVVDDTGVMRESASGIVLDADWSAFVRAVRDARGKRGGTTGCGPLPRDVAVAPVIDFVRRADSRKTATNASAP
jgi:dienelactone hydrolase